MNLRKMMMSQLPSQQKENLARILGHQLVRVERWLFMGDQGVSDFEQQADGPISLHFSNGQTIHVAPFTEGASIQLSETERSYGESYVRTDVTRNEFWRSRVNLPISGLWILQSIHATPDFPMEFGIEIRFNGQASAIVEYVDTADISDTLRICGSVSETRMLRIPIVSSEMISPTTSARIIHFSEPQIESRWNVEGSFGVFMDTEEAVWRDDGFLHNICFDLLKAGCRWFVCFGKNSEQIHDRIDDISIDQGYEGIVTTFHSDEPRTEAASFFKDVALAELKMGLVLVCDRRKWAGLFQDTQTSTET